MGDLGDLSAFLVVLCAGIMHGILLLLLSPQKWWLGFGLFFCILLFIICPNCTHVQLFLVPYSLLLCCSRRCLSWCKHSGRGVQVPAYLLEKLRQWTASVVTSGSVRTTAYPELWTQTSRILLSLYACESWGTRMVVETGFWPIFKNTRCLMHLFPWQLPFPTEACKKERIAAVHEKIKLKNLYFLFVPWNAFHFSVYGNSWCPLETVSLIYP